MDMRSWKKVLLQWITECGFMERNYFNIEQSDIDAFYQNFSLKHQKTATEKFTHLGDFLKEFYPSFDINFDDENCLSSADYIYVYSLLLHFCCVKHPESFFHEICQRLPDYAQQYIAAFFKELLDTEPITKEALRHCIAEVANRRDTPPRLNDSYSSNITTISVGGLSSASFTRCESPLKTPKRCAGPQRISPSTPKSYLLEERTKELYNLRAQLETERYEKGLLEVQIKQNEDQIQKLNNDHKKLIQQIQDLKNEILVNTSDGSANREGEENQIQKRLLKELSHREQEIFKQSDIVRSLREEKSLVEEKLNHAEKQICMCMNRIKELDFKVDELNEELEKKVYHIKYLTDSKIELEQFISETRSSTSGANPDLNASVDCLDSSLMRSSNDTNSSNSINSPENLGASVVDVQLREKEHENQLLKQELQNVKREHKRLAKHLTKLTQEFDLPIDASSPITSEESEVKNKALEEIESGEESSQDGQLNCEEQFSLFNNCMQKINKFHKIERNKIKQLEQEAHNLQEENSDLNRKLCELKDDVQMFKEKLNSSEKINKELDEAKQMVEKKFKKSQIDLENAEKQKENLYTKIQSLEQDTEALNENILVLKSQLELQQKEYSELLANNSKLNEQEVTLNIQLKNVQREFSSKTLEWENDLNKLNSKINEQIEEISNYKQTEQTIKRNYEELLLQKDELQKEARQANCHLTDMKNELMEKEKQIVLLGKEITDFKQKNQLLEQNINTVIEQCKQEQLASKTSHNEQCQKLKNQLTKMESLIESKQHDCDLKQQQLNDVESKVSAILKTFGDCPVNEDVFHNLKEIEMQINSLSENNKNLNSKVLNLEESQEETSTKLQELHNELMEKSETCMTAQEELLMWKKENEEFKMKIEKLQQENVTFTETMKKEMEEKNQELQDRLEKTSLAYEDSLQRMNNSLRLEKEHHNNKEMELLLITAEHSETKKKLSEAEEKILQLQTDKQQLQQSYEQVKQFEIKAIQCSEENDKLRQEIETIKGEVTQNALRLLEADNALAEYMELTKKQKTTDTEMEALQITLREKEETLLDMELKVQQLEHQLEDQTDVVTIVQEQLEKLTKDKERLSKEIKEKSQEILKEQQDKLMLLSSLEKSTDQFKLAIEEKEELKSSLEQKLEELKEQFDGLTLQNTKLQGDLVEREAELRLSLDELQQEKEDFQQKLSKLMQTSEEKSEELESIDVALMEIIATVENNFNLAHELLNNEVDNIFNYNESAAAKNRVQKLRQQLNYVLHKYQQLNKEMKEVCCEKEQVLDAVATLKDRNSELQLKLNEQETKFNELKQQLENEELIVKKKVFHEVERLEGDLSNLEKVNERLANENVKIQVKLSNAEQDFKDCKQKIVALEADNVRLQEEVRCKSLTLENLQQVEKELQQMLKEKSQQSEEITEKFNCLEFELKDKTSKLQKLEKEYQESKENASRDQQKLFHYQQSEQNQQMEHNKLEEKFKILQSTNESLEMEIINKNKELLVLKNENSKLLEQNKDMEEEFAIASKRLDELSASKLDVEIKCEQLYSEVQQYKRDLKFTKSQQQIQLDEYTRLTHDIELLKIDKQHLTDEISENKLTLQRSNDNVSQLIQQISSIRLEKESALEENLLLRKQLEETGKHQTSSETKMKSVTEKSQDLERKLLSAENELKSLKASLEKSESSTEKLLAENRKLRDSQETTTKRIEKLALKLGDSQAKSAKLERDNDKLNKTLEAHSINVEALQKEKDLLQTEAKSLKERLSRAERSHEQLSSKVQNLEHLNANLQQIKQKLESSEIEGKMKLNKLEKMRSITEERLRQLTNSLNNAESANVKLNLEVGSLNSQLQELKLDHKQEQTHQIEELNLKFEEAQELNRTYEEINEKLKIEVNTLKEENSTLNDQLSKASLSLQITSEKCERFASEIEQIRAEMLIIRQEKSEMALQLENFTQKLTQAESQNTKLTYERTNAVKPLEQRIAHLEEELAAKTKEVADLQKDIEVLKENSESQASLLHQNTTANISELEELRTKLSLAENIREKEQQIISQLRLDNQILHTKYQESKQRALDATKLSEERIKENRLELEGKLEKMKNKMKTLYTEEITKMKSKQERETAVIKSEMEVLKSQNTKYEEHIRKLSSQIVRLNDNILQYQKDNTILSTKLKHITEQLHDSERNKCRPSSIHVSTISSATAPVTGTNIGSNFAMEDEEGEVFNNTYLTDLKNGHMTDLMSRDVCVEELKYRNSLLPPHLRSTYAAQFDHEFSEEDLKDGPHSLDDSMSALLSTTAGGIRKKCSGVTHYKRPGPPTPSKHGGRLSFGGNSEPSREILKESYDTNTGSGVSSTKTPARFNFFVSRFSMGTTKDEKPIIKKESDDLNLRKIIQKTNIKGSTRGTLSGVGCTSTPRKSKVYYDQRRLLDQLITSSPSPSPLTSENVVMKTKKKLTESNVSFIETPLTALDGHMVSKAAATHQTNSKRIAAIAGGLRRFRRNSSMFGRRLSRRMQEICTPTSGETTSSAISTPVKDKMKRQVIVSTTTTSGGMSRSTILQRRLRKKPKREIGARPSLHLKGNIFAKCRAPNKKIAYEVNRCRSRKQRREHFNMGRNIRSFKTESQEEEMDKTLSTKAEKNVTYNLRNNNYATFNHNTVLGETVVIEKCQLKDDTSQEGTFTFGEEQFESEITENYFDYADNYESVEEYDDNDNDELDIENKFCNKTERGLKYNLPIKHEYCKPELITTQDLENFDRFIAEQNKKEQEELDDYLSEGNSQHFEKLVIETESNAPFDVTHIHFNVSGNSQHSRNSYNSSSSNQSRLSSQNLYWRHSQRKHNNTTISTATPHLSPNNPTCQLSRTIYGGTVIYNHRLPNINTTFVRKSSIYIKNRNKSSAQHHHHRHHHQHHLETSSCNDDDDDGVVLITNQTITFIDIMRMWSQMDSSARLIVSFAVLASFTTLLGLILSFSAKR